MLKKKIWANFQRIIELFTHKLSLSSQKYGFEIRDPEKTYSGSRSQKGTGSRIRNTVEERQLSPATVLFIFPFFVLLLYQRNELKKFNSATALLGNILNLNSNVCETNLYKYTPTNFQIQESIMPQQMSDCYSEPISI